MRIAAAVVLTSLAPLLTGCGTSTQVNQPLTAPSATEPVYAVTECTGADEQTCRQLRDQVEYALLKQGLSAKEPGLARRNLKLTITGYRDVGAMGRAMLGVLSGADEVKVQMDVIDVSTGQTIGSVTSSCFNFSAANSSRNQMISGVARELVAFLTKPSKG